MAIAEDIVVTGMGAVSPNGVGLKGFTEGLREGRSGLTALPFEHEHVSTCAVAAVALDVADFEAEGVMSKADQKRLPRLVPMGLMAAREAMAMAGLGPFDAESLNGSGLNEALERSRRVGLILGSGGGGIDFTIEQFAAESRGKSPSLWTITNATHGNLAGELSIRLGLRGPSHCVSTGCSSSSDAFGTAMMHLRSGQVDAMVVGGADAHLVPETIWTMELLGVISQGDYADPARASRPFDRDRDGFILGEGAWFTVIETRASAERRGAEPIATLSGYASTCDAYHRVRPDPDGAEAVRAIRQALDNAGLSPGDIDYVHYHGTSTQLNDVTETRIMHAAFGDDAKRLPGSSVKSMIGHPQGACGAASLVATIAAMTGGDGGEPFLPPTINFENHDPACDLDYVPNESRAIGAEHALVNCLAFGAKNSVLVVSV